MCKKQDESQEMRELHHGELDKVSGGASDAVYFCPDCDEYFYSLAELQAHQKAEHDIIACPMCNRPMNRGSTCEICGYVDVDLD